MSPGFRLPTSTCIPPRLRFQAQPRTVLEPTSQNTSVCNGTRACRRRLSARVPRTVRNRLFKPLPVDRFLQEEGCSRLANACCIVVLSSRPVTITIGVDLVPGGFSDAACQVEAMHVWHFEI